MIQNRSEVSMNRKTSNAWGSEELARVERVRRKEGQTGCIRKPYHQLFFLLDLRPRQQRRHTNSQARAYG